MKLKLNNVTLLGIDCVNVERLQVAMDICQKGIEFGAVKLLTSLPTNDPQAVKIPEIGSVSAYSRFCMEDLHAYVDTDYVLMVQHDGFILNPNSWSDDFLKYDYIGAPWIVADWSVRDYDFPKELLGTKIVGNGGFSLRSKKLLETASRLSHEGKLARIHPEDVAMSVWHRKLFEQEGIKFAPPAVAARFSVEGDDWTYGSQFGFHGFAWTDISAWIKAHPEYPLIAREFDDAKGKLDFLRGTIVENSLAEASILKQIPISGTHVDGSWIIHSVKIPKLLVPELAKHIADGPWYAHFWDNRGKMKIVFKNKVFDVKTDDKNTWKDAIAYGVSMGIPEEQLDFLIE